jgi:hypothetical protein
MNSCEAVHCTACCEHTNMLLTAQDIARIEALGHPKDSFSHPGSLGEQLKNTNGHCVFLKAGQCTIYTSRPHGCTLYPIVYDKSSRQAILDDACPRYKDFPLTNERRRQLQRLITTLFPEGL